jgi:hypothetical protein
MKPELPPEIISIFPPEIVDKINSFVPHYPNPKKKSASPICTYSPQMERDIRILQSKQVSPRLGGKKGTYLYDLDEFVLD